MRQKGMEKDRIVGKNRIEGQRTDGNGRRRTENVREQILRNNITGAEISNLQTCDEIFCQSQLNS